MVIITEIPYLDVYSKAVLFNLNIESYLQFPVFY